MMLEALPLTMWPDSWLFQVRGSILRAVQCGRVGPSHDIVVGEQWLEAIDAELDARGFRFRPYWKDAEGSTPQVQG